jgi:hypothetical protein
LPASRASRSTSTTTSRSMATATASRAPSWPGPRCAYHRSRGGVALSRQPRREPRALDAPR